MSAVPNQFWDRRCSVLLLPPQNSVNNPSAFVANSDQALELSDMHVVFETKQEDEESPNNCSIRVENLSAEVTQLVQESYQRVVLQAGYWGAPFGVIFEGEIKQFRKGRTDAKTTYLDILAADGDLAYTYATINRTLAAGSDPQARVTAVIEAMAPQGVQPGDVKIPNTGGILPRGKVLFGLAKSAMRQIVRAHGSTWNISGGKVNVTPLDGYLEGEAVVLTAQTGLIGRAEQTEGGVRARCFLNPRIQVGGLVRIDNASINVTEQQASATIPGAQLAYDRYAGVQMFADVAADGLYRVYVAEFSGDTRGQDWYADLILLAVNESTGKVAIK